MMAHLSAHYERSEKEYCDFHLERLVRFLRCTEEEGRRIAAMIRSYLIVHKEG